MKLQIYFLSLSLFMSFLSHAQLICADLFSESSKQIQIIEVLHQKDIPYYLINIHGKSVPVILANKTTIDLVQPLFDGTVGFQVMSKAGWPNDHGSFRYGSFIIDAFLAGQRQVGEIHETGLSWKTARDSAYFLDKIADIIGEAVISVSAEEKSNIDFYHRVRRAALYRIPFLMGDQKIYQRFDNVLYDCGGYCFEFSHSGNVYRHVTALNNLLNQIDPNSEVRSKYENHIANFIKKARQKIAGVDLFDANQMSEKILTSGELEVLSKSFIPEHWPVRQKQLFLNYLVSENAAKGMSDFVSTIKISHHSPIDLLSSPRVQALVVWDPKANVESFRNASYRGHGQTFSIPSGVRP